MNILFPDTIEATAIASHPTPGKFTSLSLDIYGICFVGGAGRVSEWMSKKSCNYPIHRGMLAPDYATFNKKT